MRTSRSRPRPAVAAVAALSIALTGIGTAQATPSADPVPRGNRAATTHQVTLITGDRVTVTGDKVSIEPGPGREKMTFKSYRDQDRLTVIPADQLTQVASGRLDRRLFDVTGLIEAGYDDARSRTTPLIVTFANRAKRAKLPGATRELPVLNGTAVKVPKNTRAAFLQGNQIKKIWLDGKREPTLDQSVAQIGAPAAWQAGYTGKGVNVAVLDTGIDATHPDLAGQLAGARNFTDTPDGDQVGHGTHVASTIAGTGAASAGKYKGVAPEAKLYDGKVCADEGCSDSAILAGLEWAATEVKAKVVNFSIGGQDTPEIDPVEEAVNRLTKETGTLFVVAAGNSGPGSGTIDSPGSADAALTVGAVDRQDRLAPFSSRGPRMGDGAIKPDVTAPGVGIVAARSADSIIGQPVGDKYLKLSGTSMATPHTVGAVALLAQQHPDWKAAELKAALTSSARAIDGQTAFEQGAGRIDAARASTQTVVAEPSGLSFGKASWPHHDDAPVIRKLTYHNLGAEPVTLDLTAELTGPDGKAAPAEAVKLDADSITIPAGGSTVVTVTSDTRHSGPDGAYSGRITAAGAGATVRTPIAVEREVESYDLTAKILDPEGEPAMALLGIFGMSSNWVDRLDAWQGTVTVRLPKGDYLLDSAQATNRPGTDLFDLYNVVNPKVSLTADTTVVLDARTTKSLNLTVPDPKARMLYAAAGYEARTANHTLLSMARTHDLSLLHWAHVGPDLPTDRLTGFLTSQWGRPGADGRFRDLAELYATADGFPGRAPDGFDRKVVAEDLAVVEQTVHATAERDGKVVLHGRPAGVGAASSPVIPYRLPASRRLLVDAGSALWATAVDEFGPGAEPEEVATVRSQFRSYPARRTTADRVNAAVLTPKQLDGARRNDSLYLELRSLGDADGAEGGTRIDTAVTKLFRNGEQLFHQPIFGYAEAAELPADEAEFKFTTSLTRPSYSAFSTRIDYSLTFRSGAAEAEPLPLLGIRYQPKVDRLNTAERTTVTVLPVVVDPPQNMGLPTLRKTEVQVSGDGGKTWQAAAVTATGKGRYKAVFRTPGGSSVSLRAKVVDGDGNVVEQTVIDAYLLK